MRDVERQLNVRNAILDATDRLLCERGYKKMRIDDLADEVGIGKGTVYLYFPSKEEIALSHIDRIVERLIERLHSIARDAGLEASEKIRRMLVERVLYRFDSVQNYSQSINELLAVVRPQLIERRRRHFAAEADVFAGVLAEAASRKDLSVADPGDTSDALITATNSLLPYSLSARELGERGEIEARAERVARLCIDGLKR